MDLQDGITIGSFITELYFNSGVTNSSAIGKAYDLKLRTDKSAQDSGVKNNGITDTSNVYEVIAPVINTIKDDTLLLVSNVDNIRITNASIDTILSNAKDPLNSAIATLDVEHYEIHEGEHFFHTNVIAAENGAVTNYLFTTGANTLHLVFSVFGNDAGVSGLTYENVVANVDGTLLTPINNNRMSSNLSTATIRLNPTGINTTGSVLLRTFRTGAGGNASTRQAGSVTRTNEVIFKPNTKYLLQVTNLSTSTNNISFEFSWYEK